MNKSEANTIFAKYQADRAYGDALELGVVYRCDFERINKVSVQGNEYNVQFFFRSINYLKYGYQESPDNQ